MSESLNVIALISGGKDSFYSLIHCVQNGHKVVALGNLHPRLPSPKTQPAGDNKSLDRNFETREQIHGDGGSLYGAGNSTGAEKADDENEERDLNSFMYQTVGHTVIPLYEKALGIPLYRQEILGTAVETGTSYHLPPSSTSSALDIHDEDETESLVPLLKRIMAAHPESNAISTGAILSTYQRTRVESVALRLGLVPLSFLWQYPVLPPATQISLLQDMSSVSLDARIIKVASGGLDEEYLWENVASVRGIIRVERAMKRFGNDGDGSVIGEGGEFETLVVDGPDWLFKGRIEIDETDRRIVREGGGAAWLAMERARVVMKEGKPAERSEVRVPNLLDEQFEKSLSEIGEVSLDIKTSVKEEIDALKEQTEVHEVPSTKSNSGLGFEPVGAAGWTIASNPLEAVQSAEEEMASHLQKIKELLATDKRPASDITFALIMLRSMDDFAVINKIYGSLFTEPNPPARVTVANGNALPKGQHVILHLTLRGQHYPAESKKALHVQSRSYWAPANIGPYSQAISIPQKTKSSSTSNRLVHVAGQIPLVPGNMTLPEASPNNFELQTILSLQHLWRIGTEMNISWWTSAVAFLPRDTPSSLSWKAQIASRAWDAQFRAIEDSEEEEERDLWEEKHRGGFGRGTETTRKSLPDWEAVDREDSIPPFFAAEVETLPRGSGIEWYAHLGIVGAGIKVYGASEENLGTTLKHTCYGGDSFSQSVLLVPHMGVQVAHEKLERIRSELSWDEAELVEIYTDANLWVPEDNRRVIPCRSLWDKSGERLAAVFITRNPI